MKKKVDGYKFYTPSIIKQLGYHNHMLEFEPGLVSQNKGMNMVGNCAWRPLIILLEMEKIKDNDIVVYRDINCNKYPTLKNFNNFKKSLTINFYHFFSHQESPKKYLLIFSGGK